MVYPIGMVATVVPLFPGGLGLGHASFEVLFQQFGLSDGANIFNMYFMMMLMFNLLGVFPYLFFKKDSEGELQEPVHENV